MQPLAVTIQGAVKVPDSPATVCSAEQSWDSCAIRGPGAASRRLPGQKNFWSLVGPHGAAGALRLAL